MRWILPCGGVDSRENKEKKNKKRKNIKKKNERN
jgi:hypothetical protein